MYRTISDKTWADPWHQSLSPAAKCVFHFLVEGAANNAGVAEVSPSQLAFHTGVSESDLPAAIAELAGKVQHWESGWYFVVNLHRHQKAKSNSENFIKSARNQLAGAPDYVVEAVAAVYPDLVPGLLPPAPVGGNPLVAPARVDRTRSTSAPSDFIAGLVEKLRATHPAWEPLAYSTIQKALTTYGRETVTYALQSLIESGTVPKSAPHPLFVTACKRVAEEAQSA